MKEVAADDIPRPMQASAVRKLNLRCVRIGVRIGRIRVGGIDADVMTRHTFDQFPARRHRPFFDVRGQPIGVGKDEISDAP